MRSIALAVVGCCLAVPAFAASKEDPLLEETLVAGGAKNEAELRQLVAQFHRQVDPIVRELKDQPEAIAAQLLLRHLHQDYQASRAPLRKYEIDAFSLNRVLADGHYNCLSATTLYVLAARQAGLDVKPEFYDDHARAVLVTRAGKEFQVETTGIDGFDLDRWVLHTEGLLQDGAITFEFPRDVTTSELVAQISGEARFYGVGDGGGAMLASRFSATLK